MGSLQKMGSHGYCECKPPINFSVEFPNHKVVIPNSHEYQFEAFIYTCVILLNYLLLTTILMVKLICFAPRVVTGTDVDEKRAFDMKVLNQFREREKRKNGKFEIESRRQVKERMVKYLKSMQHMAGYSQSMDDDRPRRQSQKRDRSSTSLASSGTYTAGSPIRRAISSGDYSVSEDDQQDTSRSTRLSSSVSFSLDAKEQSQKVEKVASTWRRRVDFEDIERGPVWMTKAEAKDLDGMPRRYTYAEDSGTFLNMEEPEFEHYV